MIKFRGKQNGIFVSGRSLQDRIEKLVEKQAEDAKAREVLEATY